MVKFTKTKNTAQGPSSALGIMVFSDPRKSLFKLSPELVLVLAALLGLIVLLIQLF